MAEPARPARHTNDGIMSFEIHLDVPANIPPDDRADVAYDPELDDLRSILRDVCASLADLPGVRFAIVVEVPVPVSVRMDLVIVMEQLLDTLATFRQGGVGMLDLYEQGIEAQLVFAGEGELVRIERRDLMGRSKPAGEVRWARDAFVESLSALARTFVDAARRRSPRRAAHPWFAEWAQELLAVASP